MPYVKIRPRRGTKTEWEFSNPILSEGEFVLEIPSTGVGTGLIKAKIGDGARNYKNLPYAITPLYGEVMESITGRIDGIETVVNGLSDRTVNGISWGENQNVIVTANPTSNSIDNSTDLNTIQTTGFYYAGGANTSPNKPAGIISFGLLVYRTAFGYITQDLIEGSTNAQKRWSRQYAGTAWSPWIEIYTSRLDGSETPTASNLGTITTHTAIRKGGVGRYKLAAISGNWVLGNWYLLCTLSANYRPSIEIKKEILLSGTYSCNIVISTTGSVNIFPRSNINNIGIWIDETYTI